MNTLIKYTVAFLFYLTGSLLWLDSASGAKPGKVVDVTAAVPDAALQGQNLDVTVSGSGFDSGSTVRFLIPATETDPEDDSQVEVIGEILFVKEKGQSEKLIVPVHVLNAATIDYYDIEVTTSGGRRGKGTDLFKVELNTSSENRKETGTTECNDGIDNDGDDFIDGEDPDCYNSYDRDQPKSDRGNSEPLIVTLDDVAGDNLLSDGNGDYVDGDNHVSATAGGIIPHRIVWATKNRGKNPRQVIVTVVCEPIPSSDLFVATGIDRCEELATTYADIADVNGSTLTFVGRYISAVIPYTVNCPEASSACPDVFTMGVGTKFMSFKLSRGIAPNIEAASDIGGGSVSDPGRCLSQMTTAQRTAWIANNGCTTNPANCNAAITASDNDTDGENDTWRIDAVGIKALICKDGIVYGQTTLTLGFDAVQK